MAHGTALLASLALLALTGAGSAMAATPSQNYLNPRLDKGERLVHVFSRAISIKGVGFHEYVTRVSGTTSDAVKSIGTTGIVFRESYRYDGHPAGSGENRILADGATSCWNGKCTVNHQTSGATFNHLLWGNAPANLHTGTTWKVAITASWELGPSGLETVRVVHIDPANHTITLYRQGHGTGFSLYDQRRKQLTITTDKGKLLEVSVEPGETRWSGRTIVRDGIIVSDTIMVKRRVTLTSASGRKFEGEERAYTLENLLQDET